LRAKTELEAKMKETAHIKDLEMKAAHHDLELVKRTLNNRKEQFKRDEEARLEHIQKMLNEREQALKESRSEKIHAEE
jgi:hypothetical protein